MEINVQSDVGRKRNTNQDYANVFENQQHITFAVLADGMGGHQAGDVASQMAVNNLGESWSNASVDSAEKSAQWLIQAIQKENEKIYERGQSKPEYLGMGDNRGWCHPFTRFICLSKCGGQSCLFSS